MQQQQFPEEVAVDSDSGIKFQISDTNKNKKRGLLNIEKALKDEKVRIVGK